MVVVRQDEFELMAWGDGSSEWATALVCAIPRDCSALVKERTAISHRGCRCRQHARRVRLVALPS